MSTNPNERATVAESTDELRGAKQEPPTGNTAISQLFCDCGGILTGGTDGWMCKACGTAASKPSADVMVTTHQEERNLSVVTDQFFVGPKTSETCPECKHDEAYYRLQQTRSADESETRFFTCASCEHEWRVND